MDSGYVAVDYIPTQKEQWERRMISASLTINLEEARCLGCGYLYMPRYIGEQVCKFCRKIQWRARP